MRSGRKFANILWAGMACLTLAPAGMASAPAPVKPTLRVRVPMRDGIKLDTNIFLPQTGPRFPVLLVRTPYGKGSSLLPNYRIFVQHGYAIAVQDVRGRYGSEGSFNPLYQEGPDGYDTLNWIGHQAWSDGNVGMIGGSYLGIVQWDAALENSPYLKAISPVVSGSDDYLDLYYSSGGANRLGHRLLWLSENLLAPGAKRPDFQRYIYHLPLRTADRAATGRTIPYFQQVLAHPVYDSFWKNISTRENIGRVRVPVLAFGGWYDDFSESDLAAFSALYKGRKDGRHRIVIGPWAHSMSYKFSTADFGPDALAPIRQYQISWFDHWLKGGPEPAHTSVSGRWYNGRAEVNDSPVQIFVMGINQWREEQEWPLARTRYTPMYLESKGHANSLRGDGGLSWSELGKNNPDEFVYNPRKPVPTLGGAVCCNPKVFPWGPMDQRPVEQRPDVLVYTSKPVTRNLEVTGPVRVALYVSTSAPDTDFTAKLIDVFPDGRARNLTDGLLRLRYRRGIGTEALAKPGEIYPVTIDAGVTSNVFLPGHRIRVEISSSNFPRFDRNPNTGRPVADETALKTARQTVYLGRQFPSRVLLPVIPACCAVGPDSRKSVTNKTPRRRLPRKA